MDAQKTINEVVEGVKSEGLFDQFRKECLEEFENMETYHQLKQRVENHVTSFLSKHKFHEGLQKNALRSNLRNYISKSEVLLNGITQLVDEVLSLKGKSFCLRIDKQVDKHLTKKVPAPTPVKTEPVPISDSEKPGQSDSPQNGSPVEESNSNDNNTGIKVDGNATNQVIVEGQKEILNNETVTEFTEMEIEEVEMDLSENQEVHGPSEDEQINGENSNGDAVESVETETIVGETELDVKVKIEEVDEEVAGATAESNAVNLNTTTATTTTTTTSNNNTNKIENEPENVFKPITAGMEDVDVDIKKEIKEEPISDDDDPAFESNKYEGNGSDDNDDGDMQSSLNLPPIITEPITDDSNSNDSTFSENIKSKMAQYMTSQQQLPEKKDDTECRRKSSRVRTLPLKFREIDEIRKRADDADSVSSNDIDYKDLEDGTYLTGKRGRPRKRPQSAGNPETAAARIERRSSVSRVSVDNTRRRKRSPSLSKQEEEAINFLTKPEVRKTLSREGKTSSKEDGERNSRTSRERGPDSRESRDGNSSDKDDGDKYSRSGSHRDGNSSDKDDGDKYSRSGSRRKSESEKDERKSERDRKSSTRDGSTSSKDEDTKSRQDRNTSSSSGTGSNKDEANRNSRSKRDHKSESGEGNYSGIDDDDRNSRRNSRDKTSELRDGASSSKDSDDRKSCGRRDRSKSLGSGKEEDRSSRNKKDNKSDSGGNHSEKDDSDRKCRVKREENIETREERDDHRNTYRKRFHSPAPSLEEVQSKRSRRSIKQRQRYTPP